MTLIMTRLVMGYTGSAEVGPWVPDKTNLMLSLYDKIREGRCVTY